MTTLAKETKDYCKLFGLLTKAGEDWRPDDVAPYVAHLVEQFGTQRLIWGSDWPVLTIASDYGTWMDLAMSFNPYVLESVSIFGTNAVEAYRLLSN
ncbi:amidohydrolase family protein [Octadecabacter sp. CECT 8868]|uniref:amidohydrolase family protein n=1 Tax=Octadecabacter algicola TaxID=2909342 RepID=UPI001F4425B0|nr:amidohydrolase family protein [Octadecabacter algicola]MCF2904956.1 amidohydrolase family protein [Octadecabacter algicola]